jgi:hypothetical protein
MVSGLSAVLKKPEPVQPVKLYPRMGTALTGVVLAPLGTTWGLGPEILPPEPADAVTV